MAARWRPLGTVVVAAATATCGLLLVGGVAPSGRSTVDLPAAAPASSTTQADPAPDDEATDATSTTTTISTTTTTTTTAERPTTTTSVAAPPTPPSPVPLAVESSNAVVGAGGVVTFEGTCEVGATGPLGPVVVWVVGDEVEVVDTGVTSADWSYTWTAPVAEEQFGSFTFQFWCGDPAGFDGGYPAELQHRVDMVAVGPPAPTVPLVEDDDGAPALTIPETD